jgi:hypothetical protein
MLDLRISQRTRSYWNACHGDSVQIHQRIASDWLLIIPRLTYSSALNTRSSETSIAFH